MPEKTGYVFGNGKPIMDVKHSFTSACRKAGITDFRFHDLRHTYASHLAMRGGSTFGLYKSCWGIRRWP